MNFFNALKKIVPIVQGVSHVAIPIAAGLYPPAAPALLALDNIVGRVQNTMVTVEQQSSDTTTGTSKEAAVIQDFQTYINDLKSSLGLAGKIVQYDEVELKAAITSQHDAYNHFAKVKASIKIV